MVNLQFWTFSGEESEDGGIQMNDHEEGSYGYETTWVGHRDKNTDLHTGTQEELQAQGWQVQVRAYLRGKAEEEVN